VYNSLVAAKRETKRGTHPNSLANLEKNKIQPGEVRNPTGVNGRRPYTDAILETSTDVIPEYLRQAMNAEIRKDLAKSLRISAKRINKTEDFFPVGITWARANGLRQNLKAVFEGDTRAAVEIREAVEGRATQRIEINKSNDRLKQLLEEHRFARLNPPTKPEPDIPANGESET
jgi:hypothetical protein